MSTLRNYAELMRLANVFTAVSNVWMAMIVSTGGLPGGAAVGITATSALLYLAGMVLNDVFDHRLDRLERPERPIPSGRVSLGSARLLGWGLLVAGLGTAWATTAWLSSSALGVDATYLAMAIVAYDGFLKGTRFGPLGMGVCRMFNVLLGFSLTYELVERYGESQYVNSVSLIPAFGIALYVYGITWFARTEATDSRRPMLAAAALVATAGLLLIAAMPWLETPSKPLLHIEPTGWIVLWIVVIGTILRRMVVAVLQPSPKFVQRAVRHAILSIIVVDASICLGFASPFWGLAVLALLAPATLLAQLFKVT